MARFNSLALPRRPQRIAAGVGLALAITLIIGLILYSIAAAAAVETGGARSGVDLWHLLRMTTIQAGLTTFLSLIVGIALAWALNRLRFFGRDLAVGLFASAIVTPGIIVAFGLLAVWGRAGWIASVTEWAFGAPVTIPIFGLGGILFAHVILDGAFAARVLLGRLDAIPSARLKTGQSLGLGAWRRFLIIDWPTMRGTFPGLAAIIFLLAFTSFPVVLLLGGGPANQTLEVATYSAARLDFDLDAAVKLALVQIAICSIVVLAAAVFTPVPPSLGRSRPPTWEDNPAARLVQWLVLVLCTIGFALPMLAVLSGAFAGVETVIVRPSFWKGVGTSVAIASASAALTLVLALVLATGRAAGANTLLRTGIGAPSYAYLAVPAVVLALGFFLLVRAIGLPLDLAAPVVVVVANAMLALPFAMATIAPPLDAIARSRGKLIRSLGLSSWRQFVTVEWPLIAPEAGLVIALAFCFSLGDLGVIALFGTQDFATLPLLLVRALGGYRSNDAAVISALMLLLTIAAFVLIPRLFARFTDARA